MTSDSDRDLTLTARQERLRSLVITHDRFKEGYDAIAEFHYPVKGGVPGAGLIGGQFGESRVGKSFTVRRYAKNYPNRVGSAGMEYPVLCVDMPLEGNPRAVLEAIALAMGLQFSLRMTNPALFDNIKLALIRCKVELLIFDEFQQVFKDQNKRLLSYGRDLLRKIADLGKFNILCVGLRETYGLLANDPQIVGRGGLPYKMLEPYSWDGVEERRTFRLLCDAFDQNLPFNERSGMGSTDFAYRLYFASQGNIGLLKEYIYAAGCLALNECADRILLAHFGEAYERRKPMGTHHNPFFHDAQLPVARGQVSALDKPRRGTTAQIFSKSPRRTEHTFG